MGLEALVGASAWFPSLLLFLVRIGAFVVGQPLFGLQGESRMARLVIATALGGMFFAAAGAPLVVVEGPAQFALLVAREALIGFALGLGVRLLTAAMTTAGEILSHEMGFAMATIVDPATGRTSPVISNLFETVAFLLMFELDVHHLVLRAVGATYESLPVGSGFDPAPVAERLSQMVSLALDYGMRYAVPVIGVMILLTAVLVMLARAVQNINLMEFSFGLRILLALLASAYFLTTGTPFLESMFEDLAVRAGTLFAGT